VKTGCLSLFKPFSILELQQFTTGFFGSYFFVGTSFQSGMASDIPMPNASFSVIAAFA
jgi:hypothetical protein